MGHESGKKKKKKKKHCLSNQKFREGESVLSIGCSNCWFSLY